MGMLVGILPEPDVPMRKLTLILYYFYLANLTTEHGIQDEIICKDILH